MIIHFTDRAREMVQSFLDQNEDEQLALRISTSGTPAAPKFDLTLVGANELAEDEMMVDGGGFAVFVKKTDEEALEGARRLADATPPDEAGTLPEVPMKNVAG